MSAEKSLCTWKYLDVVVVVVVVVVCVCVCVRERERGREIVYGKTER